VTPVRPEKVWGLTFGYGAGPVEQLAEELTGGLERARAILGELVPQVGGQGADFEVLSARRACLWLIEPDGSPWGDWTEAMDRLREDIYRAYKRRAGLSSIGGPGRPSPLLIQVKRAGDGRFFGVVLAFDSPDLSEFDGFLQGLTGFRVAQVGLPW
jgi:hypothetical protein